MAADPEVDRVLQYIRQVTARFREVLAATRLPAWDGPTSCPPWRVRDLAAHVISSGETLRMSVERGVAGSVEPAVPEAERERRIAEIAAAPPAAMLARLDEVTDAIERLYQGLSAQDLEAICYHRRGNRPARWYICHRLVEVAFHLWDLEQSLARPAALDEEIAAFLLPTILESNVPRIYVRGPRGEGRFGLSLAGEPACRWLLAASPERLEVSRGGGAADVEITASAATLALLVYGRASLLEEEQAGRARVEGDRALAERFNAIFIGP